MTTVCLLMATFDMSPNRRIFLKIVTTYGRSLCALVCGRFIGRWAGGGWNDGAV